MAPLQLRLNETILCRDGLTGRLCQVVLDPQSHRIVGLVIQQEILHDDDRVVPVSAVVSVAAETIRLSIDTEQMEQCPHYAEGYYDTPATDEGWIEVREPTQALVWSGYYGVPLDFLIPAKVHHRIRLGIPADLSAIGRQTPVWTHSGRVGSVCGLQVEEDGWTITHLLVRKSRLSETLMIPMKWVEIIEQSIFIQGSNEDLERLPNDPEDRGFTS